MLRKRPMPPSQVYLVLQAVSSGFYLLVTTVAAVFGVEKAHLNALQLLLVGTTLEGTRLVFQVPTGALADAVSRRLSVLVGLVLSGLGFILWGAFARFDTILLAQVLWGLGYTFVDGAQQAWIADELGDGAAGRTFIRGAQAGQIGAVAGIVCSTALATISLPLPLIWAYFVLRRTYAPLTTAWLNQSLDPSVRATIFSLQSLADSFGRVVAGVPLGVFATAVAIRAGIVAAGLLFAPALVLYGRALRGGATVGPEASAVEEPR